MGDYEQDFYVWTRYQPGNAIVEKGNINPLFTILQEAYHLARLLAAKETNLAEETFYPEHYPFTWGQVINLNYYPK